MGVIPSETASPNSEGKEFQGLVLKTGYVTRKGGLVRDILYPKEIKLKLYNDAMKFVGIMSIVALLGFFSSIPVFLAQDLSDSGWVYKFFNLVSITVSPAIPCAMTV